jgi:hypothetical protein
VNACPLVAIAWKARDFRSQEWTLIDRKRLQFISEKIKKSKNSDF